MVTFSFMFNLYMCFFTLSGDRADDELEEATDSIVEPQCLRLLFRSSLRASCVGTLHLVNFRGLQ